MLLAHRRRSLLTIFLAGMQIAWFTPFVLLFLPQARDLPALLVWAVLLSVLLTWLLLLDGLNRWHVPSPQYELAVVGLLAVSTLLFDRLLVYPGRPPLDLAWLGDSGRTLLNLARGAGQVILVILINVFLWQRAASFTSQEPSFFGTGLSFRLGVLLLILGGILLQAFGRTDSTGLVWAFFACGLAAVSLARIEDKAAGAQSPGAPLPAIRLGQIVLTILVTLGLGLALASIVNRNGIIAMVAWLWPLWAVLGFLFRILFSIFWWLLVPVFAVIEWVLRRLAESGVMQGFTDLANRLAGQRRIVQLQAESSGPQIPSWVGTALRYTAIVLVLLLLVGAVLLYLEHVRQARLRREAEEEVGERVSLGGGILASALNRLRDMAGLARRYGLSRQLLAAISVQNIYANLSRLARLRGFPRRPAQPPDDYLPDLCQAFPGQDPALARITAAYMRVHYGDRPISLGELAALRADYHQVRHVQRPAK